METKEERVNIFGTLFSCLDIDRGVKKIVNYEFTNTSYVCFPSTGLISEAHKNNKLREIYNNSFITFADGKFTEIYAKIKGYKNLKNVSGYWLMEDLLRTDLAHYFYGCNDEILAKLKDKLLKKFPNANILGFKSPPFVELNEVFANDQIIADLKEINSLSPDLVWIGISSPKQDYLMHYYQEYLDRGVMLGVGAVFLYHAGLVNKGPEILKKLALRWLWRLCQEPIRHWRMFIPGIYFLFLILKHDVFRLKNSNGQ